MRKIVLKTLENGKITSLHPWKVSLKQAKEIQLQLKNRLVLRGEPLARIVAGADSACSKKGERIYGAIVVYDLKKDQIIEKVEAVSKVCFPYVPGYLSFREGPILVELFSRLKTKPEAIIFDGQGIAHPRRMGIASHLGLWLKLPSIGCAKSRLLGDGKEPEQEFGAVEWIKDGEEIIGVILRTKREVKPVFVSPGHLIGLASAVKLILASVRGYRIPEPVRLAHIFANQLRTKEEGR